VSKLKNTLMLVGAVGALGLVSSVLTSKPAVAQGGGPTVTIGNPLPLPVRNVDEVKRVPFQLDLECTGNFGGCPAGYSVPAGKRLVVEHISARVRVPQGMQAGVVLHSGFETTGDIAVQVPLKTELLSEGGGNSVFIVSQPVTVYAESTPTANNRLQLSVWSGGTLSSGGNVAFTGTLTGYLIGVPAQ
jgi:hypothetical protein